MNHRYAYCKPEDTMMQELRQQLKKSNSAKANFDNSTVVTSTPDKATDISTGGKQRSWEMKNISDERSDASKTAELARQALYFNSAYNVSDSANTDGYSPRFSQGGVVTVMPRSPDDPEPGTVPNAESNASVFSPGSEKQSEEDVRRSISHDSAIYTDRTGITERGSIGSETAAAFSSLTPIKKANDNSEERASDDDSRDHGFHETAEKPSRTFRSPSSGSSIGSPISPRSACIPTTSSATVMHIPVASE